MSNKPLRYNAPLRYSDPTTLGTCPDGSARVAGVCLGGNEEQQIQDAYGFPLARGECAAGLAGAFMFFGPPYNTLKWTLASAKWGVKDQATGQPSYPGKGVYDSCPKPPLPPGPNEDPPGDENENNDDKKDDEFDTSPLILDLDGDGVEAGGIAHFDFGGDGFSELTTFASGDDGILVMDLNSNGKIEDGSEMFGNYTQVDGSLAANGFIALEQYDSNDDGAIDSSDDRFVDLRILRWRDADDDGYVDP